MSNFFNDKAAASTEEDRFARVLRNHGWDTYKPSLLMDKAGVDIIAINGDTALTVDVKSDGVIAKTGNLALEMYTTYDSGKADRPGWATKATADRWVILYRNEKRAISIDVATTVPKLVELSKQYTMRPTFRDQGKQTYNLLIPVRDLDAAGIEHTKMEWT